MPHTIKLAPERYIGLKPRSRADREAALKTLAFILLVVAAVAGLSYTQRHWQHLRELTWTRATGTVLKVKPVLVSQGTYSLYEAQALVSYPENGVVTQRWITIRQPLKPLGEIDIETVRWTGATCTVLWNPSNPNQMDIEFL